MKNLLSLLALFIAKWGKLYMTECGAITANQDYDCDEPPVGGTEDQMVLINWADLASVTRNVTNTQVIEAITYEALEDGYLMEGNLFSHNPGTELVIGTFSVRFKHRVEFVGFLKTPDAKLHYEALANGKYIAVVKNVQALPANAHYEIYGLDTGLKLESLVNLSNEDDGIYKLVLTSDDRALAPHMPNPFFLTSEAVTLALFEGLWTPTP